jgi:hypothetical protein
VRAVVTVAAPHPAQRDQFFEPVLAPAAHATRITAENDVVDRALVTEILAAHATAQLVALVD